MNSNVFLVPGRWPAEVYPQQATQLINGLIRFIGHDRLTAVTRDYRLPHRLVNGVRVARLRERQPLIEALEKFSSATFGNRRPLRALDQELADLANVAGHCHVVARTLPEDVFRNHRDRLVSLDGQLKPLLLEWKTASHISRSTAASLRWLSVNNTGPELVALAQGVEFEIECKYNSHMLFELLGQSEADLIAASIFERLMGLNLSGSVRVTIPEGFDGREISGETFLREACDTLQTAGTFAAEWPAGIQVECELIPASGRQVDSSGWHANLLANQEPDCRMYAQARAIGPMAVDPVVLSICAPRRSGAALVEHLWDRKFRRAAQQCSGTRGALLSFEWEGTNDPRVFTESEGIQALLRRTFDEHRHVAAISLRCDNAANRQFGLIDYSTPAYLAKSSVTQFQDVANLISLDSPLAP